MRIGWPSSKVYSVWLPVSAWQTVVINLTIINSDPQSCSACYGVTSSSFYRWINGSSERISGFSKIYRASKWQRQIWTLVCSVPSSDSVFSHPGRKEGVCALALLAGAPHCAAPPSRAALSLSFSPRFKGTQPEAVCSLWASTKPKVTSLCKCEDTA